ncbi:MAG TPA: type II toxin-antitoxin system HicA family toxin [Candidatus Deferrimicrobium sp.]|nr:type II toxin-antitoxin system HicA family toxin [Candidatus Deferrimicrobium sp.]
MGRFEDFNYRQTIKKLKKAGFEFERYAKGSHEIWKNKKTKRMTTLPNHPNAIPVATLRAIITGAGICVEEFLLL